jgi:hypothetical protein
MGDCNREAIYKWCKEEFETKYEEEKIKKAAGPLKLFGNEKCLDN